jgi:hypothetical protein
MNDQLPPPGWFLRPENWPYWMPNALPRMPLTSGPAPTPPEMSRDQWKQIDDTVSSPGAPPSGVNGGLLGQVSAPAQSRPQDIWSQQPGRLPPDWMTSTASAPTSTPSNDGWYRNSPSWVHAAMPLGARVDFSAEPAEPAYQPWKDRWLEKQGLTPWERPPEVPGKALPPAPEVPVPGPEGWYYPGAQPDPTPPVPPKDFRTRMHEALSDKNIRYYAGPGFYDTIDKFAPLAQFLPGSGAVQSMEESREAAKELEAGNYGDAAAHYAAGTASAALEFLPPAKYMTALLAGPLAKFFPHGNVPIAEIMEKAGKSAESVWRETGLVRGADGHWRFEISDKGYRVNPKAGVLDNEGFRVAPLFDQQIHAGMRENYSGLAEARSRLRIDPNGPERGLFVTGRPGGIEVEASDKHGARWKSIHELQHMIDYLERFARGGGLAEFHPGISFQTAVENYRRLAGEVAARNAQFRLFMTQNERLRKSPLKTELELEHPVPRDQQIVRFSHYDD